MSNFLNSVRITVAEVWYHRLISLIVTVWILVQFIINVFLK